MSDPLLERILNDPSINAAFDEDYPEPLCAMTPEPVGCHNCGTILYATYAAQNRGHCPGCLQPVCYTCGCTDLKPCSKEPTTKDGARSQIIPCSWSRQPACCSFCFEEAAYVFYMLVQGIEPTNPYYLRTYRRGQTHRLLPDAELDAAQVGILLARPVGGP